MNINEIGFDSRIIPNPLSPARSLIHVITTREIQKVSLYTNSSGSLRRTLTNIPVQSRWKRLTVRQIGPWEISRRLQVDGYGTMNAEGRSEKVKAWLVLAFEPAAWSVSVRWNTSANTNGRPFVACPCLPVPPPVLAHPGRVRSLGLRLLLHDLVVLHFSADLI